MQENDWMKDGGFLKNISLLIIDDQEDYGKRLSSYISNHESSPFMVSLNFGFSEECLRTAGQDIMLISSAFEDECGKCPHDIPVIVLDKEGAFHNKNDDRLYIFKYQSAEAIYRFIIETCMEQVGKSIIASPVGGSPLKVTGLFTPVRDEGTHRMVSAFLKEMSLSGRILYISLKQLYEGPALTEDYLADGEKETGCDDFSTFIYYLKQQKSNLGNRLTLMTARFDDYDLLLPCQISSELYELSAGEWDQIRTVVSEETGYKFLVFDLVDAVPPEASGSIFDEIIILQGRGKWEDCISRRFRTILKRTKSLSDIEIKDKEVRV